SDGPGRGSEFTIRLPLPPRAGSLAHIADPASDDTRLQLPCRRILVVDDNRSNATSLGVLLRALGQDVDTAHDGLTALELARRHHPDLVLLDIGLPGMEGYEVARRCQEEQVLERTMLVAMTGYGQDEDRRRSQEAGFKAHLVKPINLQDLQQLLNQPDLLAPQP